MKTNISNLIAALQIFLKYGDINYPTHCEHDELYIMVEASVVSEEDKQLLSELGFEPNSNGNFSSFSYGSA